MEFKPVNIIVGITASLSLIAGVIAFDSRYTKQDEFTSTILEVNSKFTAIISDAKNDIIDEMRTEVVKNRSVMITSMQREADDLEFQMEILKLNAKPVPRYMIEKHKQIIRQIEALQENENID